MLGGTKPGPGSDLEVQDNDESTDNLNSYWLLLQTKLNLSESMNAVDLVYCPVFNTSSGGHFASVFLLPAISKAIHMDSLAHAFTLYSTRVMHALFGFKSTHSSPASYLSPVPTASPYDTGAAYVTPIAFV
jgi:hypothetical protein